MARGARGDEHSNEKQCWRQTTHPNGTNPVGGLDQGGVARGLEITGDASHGLLAKGELDAAADLLISLAGRVDDVLGPRAAGRQRGLDVGVDLLHPGGQALNHVRNLVKRRQADVARDGGVRRNPWMGGWQIAIME